MDATPDTMLGLLLLIPLTMAPALALWLASRRTDEPIAGRF